LPGRYVREQQYLTELDSAIGDARPRASTWTRTDSRPPFQARRATDRRRQRRSLQARRVDAHLYGRRSRRAPTTWLAFSNSDCPLGHSPVQLSERLAGRSRCRHSPIQPCKAELGDKYTMLDSLMPRPGRSSRQVLAEGKSPRERLSSVRRGGQVGHERPDPDRLPGRVGRAIHREKRSAGHPRTRAHLLVHARQGRSRRVDRQRPRRRVLVSERV